MDKIVHKVVEKQELKKGLWEKKEESAMDGLQKTKWRRNIFILLFLIGLGLLFLDLSYLYPQQKAFFLAYGLVFLFIGSGATLFFLLLFRKIKRIEDKMRSSPSGYGIYEFRKHPTLKYQTATELKDITEEDLGRIASCIKDAITEIGEHYTFNIAFLDEAGIKLLIVPGGSTKMWFLHDGHSPFFIALGVSKIEGSSKKIFSIEVRIKKESYESLKEQIEQVKERARDCALKVIHEIEGNS